VRILAVDISGLFSQKWLVDNGRGQDYNQPRLSTLQAVRKFRDGHDRVAICCDSGKSFRSQIWDTYKADREDRGEPYRAQLGQTLEALSQDGCSVFRAPKYAGDLYAEADDVIGSLCQWAYESGHEVTILSADKDLMQLVGDGVRQISPLEKDPVVYGPEDVKAKLGVLPPLVPHLLALAGDSSDNYKPYPKVGPKLATALLDKYKHATAVFTPPVDMTALAEILGPKLADAFVGAGPEPARKALEVATIVRDLPLDFERLTGEPVRTPLPEEERTMTEAPSMEPQHAEPAQHEKAALSDTALQQATPQVPVRSDVAQSLQRSVSHHIQPGAYWMVPGFVSETWRLATAFFQAQIFPQYANAQQIMTIMLMAYEDGIGVATALQHAYPVHGRLGHSATYLLMRAEASGTVEMFDVVTSTDRECVIKCRRKGRAECIVRFTIEDADRAKLIGLKPDSNWKKWPVEMLLARCMTRALRQVWRDKVGGRYTPEELGAPIAEDDVLTNAREVRMALSEPKAEPKAA